MIGLYLASVMDLYRKKIIGWAYSTSMIAELALKAVENACLNVKDSTGIIIQSDLRTQYISVLFENYLTKIMIIQVKKGIFWIVIQGK